MAWRHRDDLEQRHDKFGSVPRLTAPFPDIPVQSSTVVGVRLDPDECGVRETTDSPTTHEGVEAVFGYWCNLYALRTLPLIRDWSVSGVYT